MEYNVQLWADTRSVERISCWFIKWQWNMSVVYVRREWVRVVHDSLSRKRIVHQSIWRLQLQVSAWIHWRWISQLYRWVTSLHQTLLWYSSYRSSKKPMSSDAQLTSVWGQNVRGDFLVRTCLGELPDVQVWDRNSSLQMSTCSEYDLCHPG